MNDLLWTGLIWFGQTLLIGVLVLGLGRLAMAYTQLPATRERIGTWTIRIAVLAPLIALMPAWWNVTLPQTPQIGEVQPALAEEAIASPILDPISEPAPPMLAVVEPVIDFEPLIIPVEVAPAPMAVMPPELPKPASVEKSAVLAPLPEPSFWREVILAGIVLYALMALYFVSEFSLGHWALARLRKMSRGSPQRVQTIASQVVGEGPQVLTNDTLPSPVCFGVTQPTIVLPQALAQRGAAQELKWVLAHEADHLRRGDPLTSCLTGIARALYFFCPWFWGVRRELSLAQEQLADAAAVEVGGQAFEYAEFLMTLSTGTTVPARRRALPALGVRAGRSQLFRRINMVLAKNAGSDRGQSRRWGLFTAGGLLSVAMLASSFGVVNADDPKPKAKVIEVVVEEKGDEKVGEKPKVIVLTADGDKVREAKQATFVEAKPNPKIAELKEKIATAIKAGKKDEAIKLLDELEKAMSAKAVTVTGRLAMVPPVPGVPAPPAVPGKPGVALAPLPPMPPMAKMFFHSDEATAKVVEALKKQMEAAKNPEVKEALEKALKAFEAAKAQSGFVEGKPLTTTQERRVEVIVGPDGKPVVKGAPLMVTPEVFEGQHKLWVARTASDLRGVFGLTVTEIPEVLAEQMGIDRAGALVTGVVVDSPAGKAGLRVHDIITQVGKTTIKSEKSVQAELNKAEPGSTIELRILRKGKSATVTVAVPKPVTVPLPEKGKTYKMVYSPKVRFESVNTSVNNEDFKIVAKKGDVDYVVTGKLKDGKPGELKIEISTEGKTIKATSADKLPEPHGDAVKSLLSMVGG